MSEKVVIGHASNGIRLLIHFLYHVIQAHALVCPTVHFYLILQFREMMANLEHLVTLDLKENK